MARRGMRLVIVAILYLGLAYGSTRPEFFMTHSADVVHESASNLLGLCESIVVVNGYPCKEYQVKTEDGYILSIQNIPSRRAPTSGGGRRQSVLLQHGVLMDGLTWLLDSPDESLGYILADNGFDVWIANTRGTRWSRKHETLDPIFPAYWAWSWDELVQYELPAIVDFVYGQTGQQKLHYVGHSMGTLIALASFSEGKLLDKVKSAALLSPIAYLSHMTTALVQLAAQTFLGEIANTLLHIPEFNPKGDAVAIFLKDLCETPGIDCYDLMSSFTGNNCCLNSSTVEFFLKYEPQSTSMKNVLHLAQSVRDGIVSKFDYGNAVDNMNHYSQPKPPVYNMSNIPNNLPLFLSYGGKDALSDVNDVQLLLDSLKFHDVDKLSTQFVENFAHADFVMGVTARTIVYNSIIEFFTRQ